MNEPNDRRRQLVEDFFGALGIVNATLSVPEAFVLIASMIRKRPEIHEHLRNSFHVIDALLEQIEADLPNPKH